MIEGLQVDVQSEELKRILLSRVDYHNNKADLYSKKAAELRASIANVEEDVEFGKVSNGKDISSNMTSQAKDHKDKATHFQFMLDHVVQNDVYRLAQEDLQMLGIASTRYF